MITLRQLRKKDSVATFGSFLEVLTSLSVPPEPSHEGLRRIWRILDELRRGSLSMEDMTRIANKYDIGLTPEEMTDMLEFATDGGEGDLDFDQFCRVFERNDEEEF